MGMGSIQAEWPNDGRIPSGRQTVEREYALNLWPFNSSRTEPNLLFFYKIKEQNVGYSMILILLNWFRIYGIMPKNY
jgi:hypothetical protein